MAFKRDDLLGEENGWRFVAKIGIWHGNEIMERTVNQ
jgi:hypothetical protein